VRYALVRGRGSGLLHIFTNWGYFKGSTKEMWEVLAESDDEQVLKTMLKLAEEGE